MASQGGLNYNVSPKVVKDKYGMDDDVSQREQIKKWVIFGVVGFVLALLITFVINSTREAPTDVVNNNNNEEIISEGKTTPIAPIQEPNQEIQQPVEPQPSAHNQPSVSDLPPRRQLINRWKAFFVKNWKIAVPIAVIVVIALVASIVAVVMINEEQKRAEAELALAEEAARQLELERQLEEQERLVEKPSLSLPTTIMTLLSTHVVLSIITIIAFQNFAPINTRSSYIIFVSVLLSGHSFLFIPICLSIFFNRVLMHGILRSKLGKLILAPLWLIYVVFVFFSSPFMWLVGDKFGLIGTDVHYLWGRAGVFYRLCLVT